jgi:hypothetical protein
MVPLLYEQLPDIAFRSVTSVAKSSRQHIRRGDFV